MHKGGDRFNRTFSRRWPGPAVLSRSSELSRGSAVRHKPCCSLQQPTRTSAPPSVPMAFILLLLGSDVLKHYQPSTGTCTETAKDVSHLRGILSSIRDGLNQSDDEFLQGFAAFPPSLSNGGVSKAPRSTAEESQEHPLLCWCNKVLARRCWQWETKCLSPSQYTDIPISSLFCLLLRASFEVLHN